MSTDSIVPLPREGDSVQVQTVSSDSVAAAAVASVNSVAAPKPETRIVFFCKDCEKVVTGIKVGNKYVYKCSVCHTKNVAFGTEKSVRSFYRVKD